MSAPKVKPFGKLAATLQLRRNLQSTLTPAARIGCRDFPRPGESETSFEARTAESRKRHTAYARITREAQGLVGDEQVEAKILELKKREAVLWVECGYNPATVEEGGLA